MFVIGATSYSGRNTSMGYGYIIGGIFLIVIGGSMSSYRRREHQRYLALQRAQQQAAFANGVIVANGMGQPTVILASGAVQMPLGYQPQPGMAMAGQPFYVNQQQQQQQQPYPQQAYVPPPGAYYAGQPQYAQPVMAGAMPGMQGQQPYYGGPGQVGPAQPMMYGQPIQPNYNATTAAMPNKMENPSAPYPNYYQGAPVPAETAEGVPQYEKQM